LKDSCGHHPPTVGDIHEVDGQMVAREIHLTRPEDQKLLKRLDYIFWFSRKFKTMPLDSASTNQLESKRMEQQHPQSPSPSQAPPALPPSPLSSPSHSPIQLRNSSQLTNSNEMNSNFNNPYHSGSKHVWVKEHSCIVTHLFVEGTPFTQLSYHYGVSLQLEYS